MASRFELIHHPAAASDFSQSWDYFFDIDPDLAALFREDFRVVLRGIATGRAASHLLVQDSEIRWVKLRRFSHKVVFEQVDDGTRHVLGVISGRRHPTRIRLMLGRRKNRR
ncbi:MAG: hypothetical protein IAE77_02165 [Prosthecobacter sp.]|jgi:plasmid stabilization system protein ParE|uniref:hypothetical protein n=1 Tax=Prosthecobacter sp. TaxID=1965333 RepID=UPI001A0682B7|nr:hypothetical protein [Prosthecobacter sp.]MBE2282249.1 hypothetical protein [Prosthecobacter sp.]